MSNTQTANTSTNYNPTEDLDIVIEAVSPILYELTEDAEDIFDFKFEAESFLKYLDETDYLKLATDTDSLSDLVEYKIDEYYEYIKATYLNEIKDYNESYEHSRNTGAPARI